MITPDEIRDELRQQLADAELTARYFTGRAAQLRRRLELCDANPQDAATSAASTATKNAVTRSTTRS